MIPKKEISDIDHPGNGLAVTGGFLAAYGILNIIVGLPQCADQPPGFCIGVFIPAAAGFPMLMHGQQIWNKSTGNFKKSSNSAFENFFFLPSYTIDSQIGTRYGASIIKGF